MIIDGTERGERLRETALAEFPHNKLYWVELWQLSETQPYVKVNDEAYELDGCCFAVELSELPGRIVVRQSHGEPVFQGFKPSIEELEDLLRIITE